MALGPGKYDDLCSHVRKTADADGAVVVVYNGNRGAGFSVQGTAEFLHSLPDVLELLAKQIRADTRPPEGPPN